MKGQYISHTFQELKVKYGLELNNNNNNWDISLHSIVFWTHSVWRSVAVAKGWGKVNRMVVVLWGQITTSVTSVTSQITICIAGSVFFIINTRFLHQIINALVCWSRSVFISSSRCARKLAFYRVLYESGFLQKAWTCPPGFSLQRGVSSGGSERLSRRAALDHLPIVEYELHLCTHNEGNACFGMYTSQYS